MGKFCHPHLFKLIERDVFACARGEVILILLHVGESVNLVEHHYHGLVGSVAHLAKSLVDNLYLFLELRV